MCAGLPKVHYQWRERENVVTNDGVYSLQTFISQSHTGQHRVNYVIMEKTKIPTKKVASEAASALGSLGGRAIAKRGKGYMKKIGKAGAKARWSNNKKVKLPKNFGKMK